MAKSRNFSRSKGVRQERNLVNSLNEQGYAAKRVPGSGAFSYRVGDSNLKGDVVVAYEDREYKIECKVRAKEYNRIYELYTALQRPDSKNLGGVLVCTDGRAVANMAYSLEHAITGACAGPVNPPKGFIKTARKVGNMRKLLKDECDILAIKGDHRPWIFITFFIEDSLA